MARNAKTAAAAPRPNVRKKKVARASQVARGTNKANLARARELLRGLAPPGASDVGISLHVFRRSPSMFEARAFLRWIPARGKLHRADGAEATGRSADEALDGLLVKLERGELRDRVRG